jgi:hypothetical protein
MMLAAVARFILPPLLAVGHRWEGHRPRGGGATGRHSPALPEEFMEA